MPVTSAAPGFIALLTVPSTTGKGGGEYDAALDDIFQIMIQALAGLTGGNVVSRWQHIGDDAAGQPQTQPIYPSTNVDWAAFGVTRITDDASPYIGHTTELDTSYTVEDIEVLVSFYGPGGQRRGKQVAQSISHPRNNDVLAYYDMALVMCEPLTAGNEEINSQWYRRHDLPMKFRRGVTRTVDIVDILTTTVTVTGAAPLFSESETISV